MASPNAPSSAIIDKNPHWSGYADIASNGSVTSVAASFVLPSVTCNATSNEEQEMYFFASMDDLVTSSDFEYAGALAYCPQGSVTPFYYGIDTVNFVISAWTPSAGDIIYSNISVVSGNFVYNTTDVTTGQSMTVESSAAAASLNSAEILTDTGNCGNATVTVDCPLSNFGTVSFGSGHTGVAKTGFATISGKTKGIGGFGTATSLYKGITTNDAGTKVDASTSGLTDHKSSFIVTF